MYISHVDVSTGVDDAKFFFLSPQIFVTNCIIISQEF